METDAAMMKFGELCRASEGFTGNMVGWYVTREGERGIVVQQQRTGVVRLYPRAVVEPIDTNQKPSANESA